MLVVWDGYWLFSTNQYGIEPVKVWSNNLLETHTNWEYYRQIWRHNSDPQPWTHLALHYLNDMSAFDSPEREAAQSTELFKKLSEEQWFQGSTTVYLKHGDRFTGAD